MIYCKKNLGNDVAARKFFLFFFFHTHRSAEKKLLSPLSLPERKSKKKKKSIGVVNKRNFDFETSRVSFSTDGGWDIILDDEYRKKTRPNQ